MNLEDFIAARCRNISLVCPHINMGYGSALHLYNEHEAKAVFGPEGWVVEHSGRYAEKAVDGIKLTYDVKP